MYIYCVHSKATDEKGSKKLGLTIHPVHRLRQYRIGDAPGIGLQKRYEGLWLVSVKTRKELRAVETELHLHFASKRLPSDDGGTSEWFQVSFDEVAQFLDTHSLITRRIPDDEINAIHTKVSQPSKPEEADEKKEEDEFMQEQQQCIQDSLIEPTRPLYSLYRQFCSVFLENPRRVQNELWDQFAIICSSPEDICYKAIVQWPTGVGKTYAILMLIVISAERCKRRGSIYRGLFVSPKNDILDTITKNFDKLEKFGITLYDGSNGKFSKLDALPRNQHLLVMATQMALTVERDLTRLPPMTHVHYDEVHRITGELYFTLLKRFLASWNTEILTGTSATPFTCSPSQREKITELFGNPLTLLHRCGVDEAVKEGWIAKPRFIVSILPPVDDTDAHLRGFVMAVGKYIQLKNTGGKFICYIETRTEDVVKAADIALEILPLAKVYSAIDGERSDKDFIKAPVDKTPRILFACQRYREGADIRGLEMTAKLLGNTSAAYILLQICGRAGRIDNNKEKEGWCLLVRPSEKGTTEQDVLDSIILDIIEFMGKSDKPLTKKEIEDTVRDYIGDISMSGGACSLEETIARVKALDERREYLSNSSASTVRKHCIINGITHSSHYDKERDSRNWPSKPWDIMQLTPYEFFHPNASCIELSFLKDTLIQKNIRTLQAYREQIKEPSVEEINDGYFRGITNLNDVLPSGSRRR
jgi:superfamily II DNA or RNA helicase